jgi:hypothetical protein
MNRIFLTGRLLAAMFTTLALTFAMMPEPVYGQQQKNPPPTIEFEARYWYAYSDFIYRPSLGVINLDFKAILDLPDKGFPEGRITYYATPNHRFRADYTPLKYSVSRTLAEARTTILGQTFTSSARIRGHLDIDYLKLGWIWQFLNTPDNVFKLGTLVEITGADLSYRLLGAVNGSSVTRSSDQYTIGYPAVGLAMDLNPHRMFNIFMEASGIVLGDLGNTIEMEAGVKLLLHRNLTVTGGYRYLDIHYKGLSRHNLRLTAAGPFGGLTLRF